MTAGFGDAVAVVRLQLGPDSWRSSLPMPTHQAVERAIEIRREVTAAGDGPLLIGFEDADTVSSSLRARDIVGVDVVSTEDPGAAP